MPDHGADPLWDLATEAMVDLDGLPLSGATRTALREWSARWESMALAELYETAGDAPADTLEALERDGRLAWQQVRQELGDDWQVGWVSFPDGRRRVQWQPGGPAVLCLPGSSTASAETGHAPVRSKRVNRPA